MQTARQRIDLRVRIPRPDRAQCQVMRRGQSMLLSALVACVLLLCGYCASAAPVSVPASPRVVTVGGDHDNPPYEFLKDGVPTGFNVELIQAVAEVMNLKVAVRLGPWQEVRANLEAGTLDALAGMYYTEERAKEVDFSGRTYPGDTKRLRS
ncbi:MAG: transporter substrate-binding domain-containing protein [Polyangiaceae bacterium]